MIMHDIVFKKSDVEKKLERIVFLLGYYTTETALTTSSQITKKLLFLRFILRKYKYGLMTSIRNDTNS